MATEPDLARIYSQGRDNLDSLTSDERMRFNLLMITLVRRLENAYIQKQSGILNEDHWAGFGAVCDGVLRRPGGRAWWENSARLFTSNFGDFLEGGCEWPTRRKAATDPH